MAQEPERDPVMTVTAGGQVHTRSTEAVSLTLLALWRRNPAMMIPDSAGYRPPAQQVDLADL
jgi:hypothetical protein